jgi:hypothetical protein
MNVLRTRWRPLMRTVAAGLLFGLLLTPVGMAHLDAASDVCDRTIHPVAAGDPGVSSASLHDHLHDHCYTCRWLQSFRSTLLVAGVPVPAAAGTCPLPAAALFTCETIAGHALPARAPPAS